ncbi:MBL fold metallo-hydrolase [Synechococcus sp. BSF8S]|uniref:MBL fold metallo-hydrolase n=1 Tax=unclassified Synechococcus TaxID=2626047 RepID=UPI001623AF50|nr:MULTISPECIES: MBL fold metallo-hydrolase [unclassified Synechococcus]MBC1259844.1 MBL fold metallo-hydrolase [Synechococcus sp. BSF8S]MBC1262733.1 MBL fold metallo-hydrolase [Synechococcus sp. BSA11S]
MASASGQRHHGASPNGNRSLSHLASALGAAALVSGVSLGVPGAGQAAGGVTVTSFGHSALLIRGGGATVLVNPFKAVGCAAGLAEPRVRADVILASSRLLDEGAPVASGRMLVTPGSYRVAGLKLEGAAIPHDRIGGRRFGQATLWRWKQGGLEIAHLGGTASALRPEDRVLIGKPDVLIIGVGGGAKVYDGAEAAAVVRELEPRRVIPVQYVSGSAPSGCDQGNIEPFLEAMSGTPVQRVGRTVSFGSPLNDGPLIKVMR